MVQFKRVKHPVNGVLLLDKPLGFSSNQALQKVKWLYQAAKAGHTGTLDPLATGLLPICFGEATKFSHYLLDANKSYHATIQLGATTSTGDTEGEVLSRIAVNVSSAQLQQAIKQFIGNISQIPPMYSALKFEGKALYEYAREGLDIARVARDVTIFDIQLMRFEVDIVEINVTCSKGTYIRTLAEDIGAFLGCGAHLCGLRRTASAAYQLQHAVTIEQLEAMNIRDKDAQLLAVDSSLQNMPAIHVDADSSFYLMQGKSIWLTSAATKHIYPAQDFRLYDASGKFLGVGKQLDDGKIAPKRLVNLVQ